MAGAIFTEGSLCIKEQSLLAFKVVAPQRSEGDE